MTEPRAYVRDGAEIYRRSFAIIRAEAELARFTAAEERVVVRLIHACGMTEIARDVVMSADFATRARAALVDGAPILCDSRMVANGITRAAGIVIERIQIGRIMVEDVQAAVLDDDALDGTLVGMSFLNRLSKFHVENGALLLVQ